MASAFFEFRAESARWREQMRMRPTQDGGVSVVTALDDMALKTSGMAVIDLPAADARRLLAWLRERYPETDTGEPR